MSAKVVLVPVFRHLVPPYLRGGSLRAGISSKRGTVSGAGASHDASWLLVAAAAEALASAGTMEDVLTALGGRARGIADAAGIAVLLRQGGFWRLVAEDGARPPEDAPHPADFASARSAAMDRGEAVGGPSTVAVATCVPMVAVPVGRSYAEAAICAWWPRHATICPGAVARIEAMARLAAIAFDNVRAWADRERMESELRLVAETLEQRVEERTRELDEAQEALRQS